ncbi:hypothetical protein [Clostridium saccharoperbutylacetonicum]|uniref:hypothetical protein n=1 Tax=Clostridium saccharoperbutylacetonicum TaxID=36745 RepID=UPI000983C225|nr:hypothetical protein [Clostridium saccharoperbutylacetonicum]AQR98133.1 DNA polymerase II [Clostridium saccharoperbutylacetonicum]NSB34026.1 hypothetical protein [Clostridium saccharoperbutylacetonicum]
MLFYDFEVFKKDWLVVVKDTDTQETHTIVNNSKALKRLYKKNIDNIWIGYNSKHYDQYILKSILLDISPQEVNEFIIERKQPGYKFTSLFNKVQLFNYDCMISPLYSLKQLEGFMGNDIRETTVRFDIPRKLTDEELKEVIFYCNHDVEQTMEVFLNTYSEFESHMSLITAFKLPLSYISKTKAQLSAIILKANKRDRNDEFNITIVDTLKVRKYRYIVEWYKNKANLDYDKELKIDVAGVPHIFAWGGLHGAKKNYIGEGIFINSDVGSYYPALMIEYGFLSRNVMNPEEFRKIRDMRLVFKKDKNPLQQPYKIVLNSTYGASKDKYNPLYDPLMANNVCVNGQLLLLDLIEHLEPHFELIQSNTDGVMFKLKSEADIPLYMEICKEWEQRSRMSLEHDRITKVIQKDVNNYMVVMEDGEIKSKGAYVKKLNTLDYDLPIVNKAIKEYFINDVPVEQTICECNELKQFQKIVKISSKFAYAVYNGQAIEGKVFRVFASRSRRDRQLWKVKQCNPFKIANTPEQCFIVNENIESAATPRKLNKQWYVDIANKRINDFKGVKTA